MKKNQAPVCPVCGRHSVLRPASEIIKKATRGDMLYVCPDYPQCDSYVGVHRGTTIPKGTMADKALRGKRIYAHKVFDRLWIEGHMSRTASYHWMRDAFSLSGHDAHISMLSSEMCDVLISECRYRLSQNTS